MDVTTEFTADKRKKPLFVKDLEVGQIGVIKADPDDENEYEYYLRLQAQGAILRIDKMRVAYSQELVQECVLLSKGKLDIAIDYEG